MGEVIVKSASLVFDEDMNVVMSFKAASHYSERAKQAISEAKQALESGNLVLTLSKVKKRRSLDANAYCWVLLDRLSEYHQIPKEDIYKDLIKLIGGNNEIFPIRNEAVETWIRNWQHKGLGWVSEIIGESKIEGYTNVISYYGSSVYDTEQMSRLIDLIVQECEQVGIETRPRGEIDSLLEAWDEKYSAK